MQPTIFRWETLQDEQAAPRRDRVRPSTSLSPADRAAAAERHRRLRQRGARADAPRAHPRVHGGQRPAVLRPHRLRLEHPLRRAPRRLERGQRPAVGQLARARRGAVLRRDRARSAGHPARAGGSTSRTAACSASSTRRWRPGRRPPDRGDRRGHHAPARRRDAADHLDHHAGPVRADQPRGDGRARDPGRAGHRARPPSACTARRGCCTRTRSSRAPACSSSGPNETFIRYIEQVLPALGEGGVEQRPIGSLISQPHGEVDESRELATLKGSARIAVVMERLLWDRLSLEGAEIPLGRAVAWSSVTAEDLAGDRATRCASARSATRPGRERFRERLAGVRRAPARSTRDSLAGQEEAMSAVRKTKEYQRLATQGVAARDARGPGREAVQEPRAAGARWRASCSRDEELDAAAGVRVPRSSART